MTGILGEKVFFGGSGSSPVLFDYNGLPTQVQQDTSDPTNNRANPSLLFINVDGVQQTIHEDTATPANTIAVPVKDYTANTFWAALIGQLARASSLGVTLSTEDIALLTNIFDKYSAGQAARAASLGVTLSTEDITLLTNVYDKYSAGQAARAASLGVALSTEDIALLTNIFDKYSAGQAARATSLGVTLSTEDVAVLESVKTALEAQLASVGNYNISDEITVAGITVDTVATPVKKLLIQNQRDPIEVLIGGNHVCYVLAGGEISIDCGDATGDLVVKSLTGSAIAAGFGLVIDLLG